ncbi:hypothetical protein [Conexibacter sp. CPCC 206217]|uniref:hypothetical protein n=1 Tax=Conexibacter sp. CPCC 206217 TaxID=3064574 RepID=UPI0027271CC6|nr:hypothetical protein [Conexibacter sp. CPCC 206217]MDO8210648.1 hypothetical protein [Conexibacter sp. CPCC 206217]
MSAQVGVVAANTGQGEKARVDRAVAAKKHHRRVVNRRLYKHFRLLRKNRGARTAVDPSQLPGLPWGVVLGPARSVTTPNGVSVTVAPGTEGACILLTELPESSETVGVGCLPTASVLRGQQWTYIPDLGGPGGILAGMAPDDYVAALVTHADGSRERVPVANNVWSVAGKPSLTKREPDQLAPLPFSRIQVQDKSGEYTTTFGPGVLRGARGSPGRGRAARTRVHRPLADHTRSRAGECAGNITC